MDNSRLSRTSVLGFGVFELDRRAGELCKSGVLVHLPPQPFSVLALLASHPGQIVTRDEIRQQIWGDDTFVDFEQGLNHCIRQIRTALGDDAETPRYIETLPRRGYRFIYPVKASSAEGTLSPDDAAASGRRREVGTFRYKLLALAVSVVVLILTILVALDVAGLRSRMLSPAASPPVIRSIAVLPLENLSHDVGQEYFADGITDELIMELSKIGQLRVIGRTSVMAYKGSNKSIRTIATDLNVDAVMEVTVLRSGNRVRINTRLVDGSTERVLWEEPFERGLGNVLALHRDVAREVARQIRIKLTPEEQQRLASARSVNPRAYDACLRGRYLWNKRTAEDIKKGLGYFRQAVEVDPNYAPAYAGVAESYDVLPIYEPIRPSKVYPKARAAAREAVRLDGSLAEGHVALGQVYVDHDWNWPAAEKEFRRAIALNPNYAIAHLRYAGFLTFMRRHDEALSEIKKARELDPLSLFINTSYGTTLFLKGDYDPAFKQWRSTLELNPNFWIGRLWLGIGYLGKGFHQDALRELELAAEISKVHHPVLSWLGYGYAVSGHAAEAREILATLQRQAKKGYVPPFDFGLVYAGLGKRDLAFRYLEKAFQQHYLVLLFLNLKYFPLFILLHSDPRFQALVRRMNFPPQTANTRPSP